MPPEPSKASKPRTRDRQGTALLILQAAREVLVEGGFPEFGVNVIARRAGCDKQLIYRYFGGLEGLADEIGSELAQKLEADLSPLTEANPPRNYQELAEILVLGFLDLLLADKIMQRIISWEMAAPSPLVTRMTTERGLRLAAWMHSMRGNLKPPEGIDAPAINAVLIASTQHLVISAAATGAFAGVPLTTEASWERIRGTLRMLIRSVYGSSHDTPD
jgi:AcrR family transcriptional regulator